MTPRPVTIIILCWNRWELTRRCLETLRNFTDLSSASVLVVDNGSTDETPERLKGYDWLRVLRLDTNTGFVRGNNAGIRAVESSSDVLLLNNDVEIRETGWLETLRATAHSAGDIGIVGCRLVLPDGRLLHAGTYILPDTFWGQQIGALETDVNQYAATRDVQGIVFACAYLRRETIDAVGGLSESYTSYFEDTDYCLRARQAGFRTVCCGAVTLVHNEHGSTSDTPDVFKALFEKSRRTFRGHWKGELERRYVHDLTWQSIMNFPSGYAMSCREILRALESEGVRARYEYVYGPGTPFAIEEPEDSADYLFNVFRSRRPLRRPDVSVVYGQGDVFRRNRGRYRIGYTMLEVDGFPAEWVRQANEMDEVWVPSRFNQEGFFRSGALKPVHVMPLGVDVQHFHPGIKAYPNPNGDFVFLTNFEWGERKQPELLLKAFNQTFRRDEPVALACKVLNRNRLLSVRRQLETLRLRQSGGRIALIYNREFPYHQLGSLYRSADCYVSAGRGEGWDMPLMEAMACGLPTIATDWGAHTEYVNEGIAYPLRVRGTIPAKALCPYYDGWSWADPDPEHLSHLLRHVFEHRGEAAEKGRRAAAEMAAKWTWEHAAKRIAARLQAIARDPRPRAVYATSAPAGPPDAELARVSALWGATASAQALGSLRGWLDSPLVLKEVLQPRQTGSRTTDWLVCLVERLGIPKDGHWLSLGCGPAATERHAARDGLFRSMLALDASPVALVEAQRACDGEGIANISFGVADLNRVSLAPRTFDVVLMCMALHHVRNLEGTLRAVRSALKPGGYLLLNEFVGPRQFQWTDRQLALVKDLLETLPESLRIDVTTGLPKNEHVRYPLEHWAVADPSEAIRSDEIVEQVSRLFSVVARIDYGGTILGLLLEHIVHNFREDDPAHVAEIRRLAAVEEDLIRRGELPSDFTVLAARKRQSTFRELVRWAGA